MLALDFDLAAAARLLELWRAATGAGEGGAAELPQAARSTKEISW